MGAAALAEGEGTGRRVAAFGETKTVAEWAGDPRARVWAEAILGRLDDGMPAEEAIGRPPERPEGRKTLGYRLRAGWGLEEALTTPERGKPPVLVQGTFLEAFGERKNVRQWSLDERCVVGLGTLAGRLERGWDLERAMTTSPLGADYSKGVSRPKGPRWSLEAFGESRLVAEWARDARCAVGLSMLQARLKAGWSAEEAIATPSGGKPCARKSKARAAA